MNCALSGACVPDLPSGYKYVDCGQCDVLCNWCCFYVCEQHARLIYNWGGYIGNACHKCIATKQCIELYVQCLTPASYDLLKPFIKSVQEIHSNDLTKNAN